MITCGRARCKNSLTIAPAATLLSVGFGTLAAIGLSQPHVPFRRAIMAILISPMIVPLIISAAGMYFFYSRIGLQGTYFGVVLAHAALGIPFVIITVTATLVGFDRSLTRAAANMGANPVTTFFKVQMPLILPGVISGGLFAFITSFDEVVVVLFVGSAGQKTLPWQMFTGLREQISPTILAVATILVVISIGAANHRGNAAPPLGTSAGHVAQLIDRKVQTSKSPGRLCGDRGFFVQRSFFSRLSEACPSGFNPCEIW